MAAVERLETSFESIAAVDELLGEILVRLPFNYLYNCKFVNKRWHSLIYSPWFGRLRLRRPTPPAFILISYSGKSFYLSSNEKLPHSLNFRRTGWEIFQWCNGLLLVREIVGKREKIPTFVVYNPATGKSRVLPRDGYSPRMHLVYEPSKSPNYRVITLMYDGYVKIYESETQNWIATKIKIESSDQIQFFCYDTIYWVDKSLTICYLDHRTKKLEKLPQVTKMIEKIPLIKYEGYGIFFSPFASKGKLYCVFIQDMEPVIFIFELLEDGTDWFQTCGVDMNDIGCTDKVFTIVRGATREESFMLIEGHDDIISYPFSGNGVEFIFTSMNKNRYNRVRRIQPSRIYNFIESYDPV